MGLKEACGFVHRADRDPLKTLLRFVILLSLIVWLGGIIFFSFVVAPDVFGILTPLPGGRHLAGDIVNRTLTTLQWIGLGCGVVFLAASTALLKKLHSVRNVFVAAMMVLTGLLLFVVTPKMDRLRASAPDLEKIQAAQTEFMRLHEIFVTAEGGVLLCGFVVVGLEVKNNAAR